MTRPQLRPIFFDDPYAIPSAARENDTWSRIQQVNRDLEDAIELVSDRMTHNLTESGYDGLLKLRSVWAYLHECYCAGGKRPTRMPLFLGGENAERSNRR